MTRHILDIVNERKQEVLLAKAKLAAPPTEEAQICVSFNCNPTTHLVRYTSLAEAKKQFDKLVDCIKKNTPCILTGATATAYIHSPSQVDGAFLVHSENTIKFGVDYQKRARAYMDMP